MKKETADAANSKKERVSRVFGFFSLSALFFYCSFYFPIFIFKKIKSNFTIKNEFVMTNANNKSILFSRVGIFTSDYIATKLEVQEHLMEKGYYCVIWNMLLFQLLG